MLRRLRIAPLCLVAFLALLVAGVPEVAPGQAPASATVGAASLVGAASVTADAAVDTGPAIDAVPSVRVDRREIELVVSRSNKRAVARALPRQDGQDATGPDHLAPVASVVELALAAVAPGGVHDDDLQARAPPAADSPGHCGGGDPSSRA